MQYILLLWAFFRCVLCARRLQRLRRTLFLSALVASCGRAGDTDLDAQGTSVGASTGPGTPPVAPVALVYDPASITEGQDAG